MTLKTPVEFSVIVVGGGIAGATCVETLASLAPDESILLLSASAVIKSIINFKQITQALEAFDVKEQPSSNLSQAGSNVSVVHQTVARLNSHKKEIVTQDGRLLRYRKLCLCTGGRPKVIAEDNPYVLGIRDTETIVDFQKKLLKARQILVVGNGGIATELVYNVRECDVVWAIKDASIVSASVDAGAARFFLPHLCEEKSRDEGPVKRLKYTTTDGAASSRSGEGPGAALGPDWVNVLHLPHVDKDDRRVVVEYKVEVKRLLTPDELQLSGLAVERLPNRQEERWPVYVELTNNKVYGCDFLVSATGVIPNAQAFVANNDFDVAEDGGLRVNDHLQTSVADVYAAGDVCSAAWQQSPHWLQMRLWTQARQMGHYAAKCLAADLKEELDQIQMDFCFEIFAHCTRFFNYKVVLLGQFNGQRLDNEYEILARVVEGEKYIKVVMRNGRMLGAVLIGETDLEETFENLILNELDLSEYGPDLLEQDLEDFFD